MEKRGKGRPPKAPEMIGREAAAAREIRALRARLGLSRDQLAAALGVTFTTVTRWETGRRVPTARYMERIRALTEEHRRGEWAA